MLTGFLISCKNNQEANSEIITKPANQLEAANWLIGKWGNSENGIDATEIWARENDSVYTGISYSIRDKKDTVSLERIRLEKQNDKLVYVPVVKEQNAGEVVKFTLTSSVGQQLIFENPEHDFPQKVSYKLITKDSLIAEISGIYKGKERSEKFPMHRMELKTGSCLPSKQPPVINSLKF